MSRGNQMTFVSAGLLGALALCLSLLLLSPATASVMQGTQFDVQTAERAFLLCRTSNCEIGSVAAWDCGEPCLTNPGFTPTRIVTNEKTRTFGFVGVDHGQQEIIIVFRATDNNENWVSNLHFKLVPFKLIGAAACGKSCEVHNGFQTSYLSLRDAILKETTRLMDAYPSYSILVTGHSLGGALAELCAVDVDTLVKASNSQPRQLGFNHTRTARNAPEAENATAVFMWEMFRTPEDDADSDVAVRDTMADEGQQEWGSSSSSSSVPVMNDHAEGNGAGANHSRRVRVYTFGAPRVGNAAYSDWASSVLWSAGGVEALAAGNQHFRVTRGRDPVPHLPPRAFHYRHPVTEIYYPITTGAMATNNNVYILCADSGSEESQSCSGSVLATKPIDHYYYMGMCGACNCTEAEEHFAGGFKLSWRRVTEITIEYIMSKVGL